MADPVLVGLAFSAGSAAFLNPCGFAMLPGYVGFAVGAPAEVRGTAASILRGLLLGLMATGGFILVFVAAGGLLYAAGSALLGGVPWIAIGVGLLVAIAGGAMALGKHISIPTPGLITQNPAGESRGLVPFFLYGAAYALASLSCTLPIFLAVVGWAATSGGPFDGLVLFLAYAGGMGAIMVALTVAISLGREALVEGLQRAVPRVQRAAGVVLVAAGSYIVYYQIALGGYLG